MLAVSVLVLFGTLVACGPAATQAPVTVVVTAPPVVVTAAPPTPVPPTPVEFKSKDSTTLVVATIGDPETFDPALCYETGGAEVIANIYETLVFYKERDATQFVPQLAERWEISDDGKTYTFYIRKGVKFHNGADLTPEDVAYSFRRGILQGGPDSPQWLLVEPFFGIGLSDIAELVNPKMVGDAEALKAADPVSLTNACQRVMEAITYDDAAGTVTMKLAQPWGPFLATIAQSWGSIMDKDWVIENGGWDGDCATWQNWYGITSEADPFTDKTNGTGPFMLDHWTKGEEVVLVRNPNYWRTEPAWEGGPTGPAKLERVILKTVSEWGTRFAMLQAGDADIVGVPRENVSQVDPLVGERCDYVAADGTFTCAPTDNPTGPLRLYIGHPTVSRTDAFFTWNINDEGGNPFIGSGQLDGNGIPKDFFSDIHVRKAFNYCFDWDSYIADALNGEAVQNVGILIPGMLGYDPNGPKYSYDPDKCVEELKQAWGGQVWEKGFRFQIAYNTGNTTRQTIAQILQANFQDIDPKFQIEIVGLPWPNFLRQIRQSRIPIFVSGWLEDIHDPHNWAQPFTIGTYGHRQRLPDDVLAVLEDLVDRGVAETDPAKRAEIYKQLSRYDYEQAIAIRLAVATGRTYMQRWVKGYYYNPIYPGFYYYAFSKE